MKKICVITGTRAEYGLLSPLMLAIKKNSAFQLQIIATGTHLSAEFGNTYLEIEKDGFEIDKKVEILADSNFKSDVAQSTGRGLIGFSDALSALKPDLVLLLGDRYECFAAASTAFLLNIPIAHISGGDVTEGAIDDALRHCITKLSYLHFTTTEVYRKRVIQLGENPNRVFNVGNIAIDNIKNLNLLSKTELEKSLGITLTKPYFLATYHPETLANQSSEIQIDSFLNAIDKFSDKYFTIFTFPNADADGIIIKEKLVKYCNQNPSKAICFANLGQVRYLSAMKHAAAIIGNSSSGIVEAPSFKVPTVNIGDRQKGRLKAESIIDCLPDENSIINALEKSVSEEFVNYCKSVNNIYGDGNTTEKIMEIIGNQNEIEIQKSFFDIKFEIDK